MVNQDVSSSALRIRMKSGNVKSSDPLVKFLYLLARDTVPTGTLDGIIDLENKDEYIFSNGWLAEWAKDAAERLQERNNNG